MKSEYVGPTSDGAGIRIRLWSEAEGIEYRAAEDRILELVCDGVSPDDPEVKRLGERMNELDDFRLRRLAGEDC
jgi:hypothetical protein